MSLKDLIFNKGGIGVSLSRKETIERLNPLIKHHMELNHFYNHALGRLTEPEVTTRLAALQKLARMDVGKLMESVFSAGGIAYNGVELEPEQFGPDGEDDALLFGLRDRERVFQDVLAEELSQTHQIRTTAVLNVLQNNSKERLDYLKELTRRRRRPTSETL